MSKGRAGRNALKCCNCVVLAALGRMCSRGAAGAEDDLDLCDLLLLYFIFPETVVFRPRALAAYVVWFQPTYSTVQYAIQNPRENELFSANTAYV